MERSCKYNLHKLDRHLPLTSGLFSVPIFAARGPCPGMV